MPYLIGIVIALATVPTGAWIGLDRRSFYTTLLMVTGTYYVLFAVMGGSSRALGIESAVMGIFFLFAGIGFRSSMWIVAGAFGGHAAFDFIHGAVVTNPGVPEWWPAFCASFDIAAAIALAWLIPRLPVRSGLQLRARL
jgi:hypothetical protein